MSEARVFPFPAALTRRERMLFEQHSGMTIGQLGELMSDPSRHAEINTVAEASLILIAVRREIPDATLDDVLNNDGWELAPPPSEEADAAPLPAPTATN